MERLAHRSQYSVLRGGVLAFITNSWPLQCADRISSLVFQVVVVTVVEMRIQVRVYFFFLWGLVCIYLTALGRMHRHIESPTLPANKRDVFSCQADDKEYKIMKIPQFIIAGTQKGGTSALYGFLKKHPKIVSATSFEPHFFDRQTAIFKRHRGGLRNDENLCRARATYQQDHFDQSFLHRNPDVLSFEKTPSYMVLDEVPARIRRVAPWAKIILTLRNPVDRYVGNW